MNLVKLQDAKLTCRNLLHFSTLTTKNLEENQENNPIYHCIKRDKIPGINLPEERKDMYSDMYSENYKTVRKEMKMTQTDGKKH